MTAGTPSHPPRPTTILFHMLPFLQTLISIFVIALLIPQTNKVNFLLRKLYESGIFVFYSEAKRFLQRLTWGSITLFFLINFLGARV